MARIVVQTDDGKTTLVDELHVTPVRLSSPTESMNLLERLEWGVREAEQRRPEPAVSVIRPRRRGHSRLPNAAASSPGFGRSFD